jgi:hypothetical protein
VPIERRQPRFAELDRAGEDVHAWQSTLQFLFQRARGGAFLVDVADEDSHAHLLAPGRSRPSVKVAVSACTQTSMVVAQLRYHGEQQWTSARHVRVFAPWLRATTSARSAREIRPGLAG